MIVGEWDNGMKRLVKDFVQDYVSFLVEGAVFVSELNVHLPSRSIDADTLIKVRRKRQSFIIHIEYQTTSKRKTPIRVCEYSLETTIKYGLPAVSFIFFLRQAGRVHASPFVIEIKGFGQIHRFNYHPTEVYNMTSEELRSLGLPGLLALVPLTKDGATPAGIEAFITEAQQIEDAGKRENVLTAGLNFASLAIGKKDDQDWLIRRFQMLDDDVLNNTPLALHIQKIGAEKARQQELERQKYLLVAIIQQRFPSLTELAERQATKLEKPEAVNTLMMNLLTAKNEQEAKQYLRQAAKRRREQPQNAP